MALPSGVSANLLHGFERFNLQISQTGQFAVLAHGEAVVPTNPRHARRQLFSAIQEASEARTLSP
jgi:hypothetical protein